MRANTAKVRIAPAFDKYEWEAKQAADRVMRLIEYSSPETTSLLSEFRTECRWRFRRTASGRETPTTETSLQREIRSVRDGDGRPLPTRCRLTLESIFGYDFSAVRVHTGLTADETARSIGAEAFTIGTDIVFSSGTYRPETRTGKRLLAHELVHVIQQDAVPPSADGSSHSSLPPISCVTNGDATVVQRQTVERCLPVSMIPGISTSKASEFGLLVEEVILGNYCSKVGCAPFATEYFDNHMVESYIAFLGAHNPHLSKKNLETIAALSNIDLKRPDILTHRPGRKEFEEIKPNSSSGLAKGREKLKNLIGFYEVWSLPYVPGTTYVPSAKIPIATAPGLSVFLRIQRNRPGLLVYDICIRVDVKVLKNKLGEILQLLLVVVLTALTRRRIKPIIRFPEPIFGVAFEDVKRWALVLDQSFTVTSEKDSETYRYDLREQTNTRVEMVLTKRGSGADQIPSWEGSGRLEESTSIDENYERYVWDSSTEQYQWHTTEKKLSGTVTGRAEGAVGIPHPEHEDDYVVFIDPEGGTYELTGSVSDSFFGTEPLRELNDISWSIYTGDKLPAEWVNGETETIVGHDSGTREIEDRVMRTVRTWTLTPLEFETEPIA